MKKILIVPLILFFFVSSDLKATHYMGGEITWECTSYGNFRFIMKLYRECYLDSVNPAPNYGDSLSLMTTVPGFSSINMVRLQGYPIDISPVCNSNTWFPHIYCDTSNYPYWTNPNLGAVQEHIYTSDVAYPNGVPLTGVPPTNGWMFYFQGCCRNPSTNIINAANLSYRLRAIMYPYNNQNVSTCFDNSPVFAERPRTIICLYLNNSSPPFKINHVGLDKELDSLVYSWGQPMDSTGAFITAYDTGYSWNSPLPGPFHSPNNDSATINPNTGDIAFKSITNGAFLTSVKVTAFKCGIKVAEIWREIQMAMVNCGINSSPNVTPPFKNSLGQYTLYVDTVMFGDYVSFSIMGTDFEFLTNGTPQTMSIEVTGNQFGDVISSTTPPSMSTTGGCLNPPCATLNPAPAPPTIPLTGQFGVISQFNWQTDCSHLAANPDCGVSPTVYNFVIKVFDDYCPAPAINYHTVTIVVMPPPNLNPPLFSSVTTDSLTGNNTLTWIPTLDTMNLFHSYYIYSSTNCMGPFTLLDSVSQLTTSSYVHLGANANSYQSFYYIESISECKILLHSSPSDTLSSLFVNEPASRLTCISVDSNGFVEVNWKSKFDYSNSFNYYLIFASDYPNGPYYLADSITDYYQTTFIDSNIVGVYNKRYYYLKTSLSCFEGNNLSGPSDTINDLFLGVFQNIVYPSLYWLPINYHIPNAFNTGPYILKRKTSNTNWTIIDSIYGLTYTDSTIFCNDTVYYMLEIYDSSGCFSKSRISSFHINNLPFFVSFSGLNSNYCTNDPIVVLTGTPPGGTFSGLGISGNQFDPSIGAGNYNIKYTYTNIYGCTDSSIQNVTVNPSSPVSFNIIDSVCANSGPYIFTGSPSGGTVNGYGMSGGVFNTNLISPGTYMLTYNYTNSFGCISTASDSITINPLPIVNFLGLNSSYCFIDTFITLTGSPSGGTFTGNGIIGNSFNPVNTSSGSHSIKYSYTDLNGCNNFSLQTVQVHPLPAVNFVNLDSSCCLNSPLINLTGNPLGGMFSGNGVSANNFNPAQAGVGLHHLLYSFTDFHNCTNTDTGYIYVNSVPIADAGNDTSMICSSSGAFIGGPPTAGLIYQWYPTNGLSDSTSSNPFASPIFTTIYTITTTDALTNCSSTDDVLMLLLNAPNVDLGNDTTICNGDSIELKSSTPALTYQWSNGDNSQSIIVLPIIKSSYILTITDGVCANADTIEVSVNSPFVSLGNDTIICSYDSIVINAGSNHDAYLWNTGQTSQSIIASSNGISTTLAYSVTITDEYCPALDSINITYTKPIANLGPDIVLYANSSTILDAGYGYSSYLWSDGSTNRTLTVDSTGIGIGSKVFIVILTDSFGCTNTDSIKVSFIEYPSPETPSTNTVIIYPNPSDGQFVIIIYGKHDELNFDIFNALGQLLSRRIINSSEDYKQEKTLNLSSLAQGVYSIKLENDDINKIIKIVVK